MDAIKNLLEKYRYADKKYQVIIPLILGLALAYYFYDSTVPTQIEVLDISQKAMEKAKADFGEASKKKNQIAKLEADLETAESLLRDLTKRLPNEVDIDLVLDNVAKLAIKTEINIAAVEPQGAPPAAAPNPAAKGEQTKSFIENIVRMGISGRFKDTVRFFDELLHLEKVVNINNIRMQSTVRGGDEDNPDEDNNAALRRIRDNTVINTTFEIITYRSAT